MTNKINDISQNLNPLIDISDIYEINQIKPSDIVSSSIVNDIKKDLKDADISSRKHSKIQKSKTKNFDSITESKKIKDIDLSEKPRKHNKIKSYLKWIELYIKNIKRNNQKDTTTKQKIKKIQTINNLEVKEQKNNYSDILKNTKNKLINAYENIKNKTLNKLNHKNIYIKEVEEIKEIEEILDIDEINNKSHTIWLLSERLLFTKQFFIYTILWLIVVSILMVFDKNIVESKINSWYENLLSIKDNSSDLNLIKSKITEAKQNFSDGMLLFIPFRLLPIQDVKNWYYVLKWWNEITNILEKSIKIYEWTTKFINESDWIQNVKTTNLLFNIKWQFSELVDNLYNSIVYYDKIKDLPNKELNDKLNFAKTKLKESYDFLDIINKDYDVFLSLLWHNTERKYLVVFQNNDEIRPTWWFMWSMATVTFRNWKVIDFQKEDVYSYEWDINKVMTEKEPAPEWLNQVTETYGFRDSNYFLSFEASANSMKSFIDKVNRKVDWIVFINQNTIKDFLKLTWWIKFDALDETITEENFSLIMSTLVEAKVFKVWALWTPKQILFDFANVFIDKLKEKKDYYSYLNIIINNIKSRDLVLYSFNSEENNLLWKLWINGKINYSDTLDFTYPVFTSVWWNKSDRYIELKYKKDIIKNTDCSIDTNLSIYRTHMFSKFEEQKVNWLLDSHWVKENRDNLINIQWKWTNKSYVRVLLPKNVIVEIKEWMNIQKFDTFQQVDYYQTTRLLESTHYDIKYKLPNPKCTEYSYKLYKQPGIRNFAIEIKKENEELVKEIGIAGDYYYSDRELVK